MSGLATGTEPGRPARVLPGFAPLMPGEIRPFGGITTDPSGHLYVSVDGEGAIVRLSHALENASAP